MKQLYLFLWIVYTSVSRVTVLFTVTESPRLPPPLAARAIINISTTAATTHTHGCVYHVVCSVVVVVVLTLVEEAESCAKLIAVISVNMNNMLILLKAC